MNEFYVSNLKITFFCTIFLHDCGYISNF